MVMLLHFALSVLRLKLRWKSNFCSTHQIMVHKNDSINKND